MPRPGALGSAALGSSALGSSTTTATACGESRYVCCQRRMNRGPSAGNRPNGSNRTWASAKAPRSEGVAARNASPLTTPITGLPPSRSWPPGESDGGRGDGVSFGPEVSMPERTKATTAWDNLPVGRIPDHMGPT